MSGEHQLPLARSSSAPAELPEDTQAEAPTPSVTEGAPALPVQPDGPQDDL